MAKIEKGIPVEGLRARYNFWEMKVGDSMFFKDEPKASQSNPAQAARSFGMCNGLKFTSRKVGNGVRIWRIK